MKAIVCGGRDFLDRDMVFATMDAIHQQHGLTLVVHGGATGADSLAGEWANERGIRVKEYRADWQENGKAGGPLRNQKMLYEIQPDFLIAFPGGKGTADMVRRAKKVALRVFTVEIVGDDDGPAQGS